MSSDSRSWIASARAASCALVALLLAGCPSEGGDTDSDATTNATTEPGTTEPGTTAPTSTDGTSTTAGGELGHAADIQAIWDANCVTGCHVAGGTGATWLILTSDKAYDSLVNKMSLSFNTLTLVTPGDADASYLMNKLNNTQGDVGGGTSPMPQPPAMALSQSDIDKVEAWIAQGAKP